MPKDLEPIAPSLAARLLAEQFPEHDGPLTRVGAGWDCVIYRVGEDAPGAVALRFPQRAVSAEALRSEVRWLPTVAGGLPLAVPSAVAMGAPDHGYPHCWSVVPWLPGRDALETPPVDLVAAGRALGGFLRALHGAPVPSGAPGNPFRGVRLAERGETVRGRLGELDGVAPEPILRLWEECVAADGWEGAPVWCHGDLHPLNVLVDGGALSAVIDWADLHGGEPAPDLAVAWMLLDGPGREAFWGAYGPTDGALRVRARGWALFFGVVFLAHGRRERDRPFESVGRRVLEELGVGGAVDERNGADERQR